MKIGFVFSGQGAQYVGMGKDFYDTFDVSKKVFEKADKALGFDLKDLIFEGTQDELNMTEITQPAILTTTIAILEAISEVTGLEPDMVAGLSLGEYSAHVCSETMPFETAVKLVNKRGKYMQEAVPAGVGGMTAIVGLKREEVEDVCKNAKSFGHVQVCNYNSPKQTVLGGTLEGLAKAGELAQKAGAKRVIDLPVSAPFHTSLLDNAQINMEKELEAISLSEMKYPIIANVHGNIIEENENMQDLLAKQVTHPVKWVDTIETFAQNGVDTIIEIGPGKALSGFIKKTDRSIKTYNVESLEGLEALKTALITEEA